MVFLLNVNHFKQDSFLTFFHHLLKKQHQCIQFSHVIFVKGTHLPRITPPPSYPRVLFHRLHGLSETGTGQQNATHSRKATRGL